ncbi:MAG: hypothetical protein KUG79_19370 [Pseudomonadales bacterium]|nr:hypothetical protein [Pseudomonadales bacterium]
MSTLPVILKRYIRLLVVTIILVAVIGNAAKLFAEEIVVVVNLDNSIDNITKKELRAIFMAQSFNFSDGTLATVVNLAYKHQLRDEFYARVTGYSAKKVKQRWSAATFSGRAEFPEEFDTAKEVIRWIKQNSHSVGYIDAASVTDDVKVVLRLP